MAALVVFAVLDRPHSVAPSHESGHIHRITNDSSDSRTF
jgi:hypothetical protein